MALEIVGGNWSILGSRDAPLPPFSPLRVITLPRFSVLFQLTICAPRFVKPIGVMCVLRVNVHITSCN